MKTIHLRSRAGADGMVLLSVPTDAANAELDVVVTLTRIPASDIQSEKTDWLGFVESTAGSIPDPEFVRQPQG